MPNATVTLDLETICTDAHLERCMTEPFPADAWKPTGNASKPETIAAQKERAKAEWNEGRLTRADAGGLSPRTGRIVVLGWATDGHTADPIIAPREGEETFVLDCAWQYIHESSLLIGFNSFIFDLRWLITRSALLGVKPALTSARLTALLRRYSYAPHFDVRMALSSWDVRASGTLSDWCQAFGLSENGSGAEVGAWHRAGEHEKIAEHCRADVSCTHSMFTRLQPFFCQ